MSSFEINKAVGAIILVALFLMVTGMIGNALVSPAGHKAASVKIADKAPAAKKAKKAALARISPLLSKASSAKGATVFKKCAACHTTAKGGKHRIGPNLWNVVNAKRGAKAGFSFSKGMKAKPGKWTYENLNAFLAKPKSFIPGTKMAFGGLKKTRDRANLIVFLRKLSAKPARQP